MAAGHAEHRFFASAGAEMLPQTAICLKCGKPFPAEYTVIGGRIGLQFHLCEACRQSNYYHYRIDATRGEHSIAYGNFR